MKRISNRYARVNNNLEKAYDDLILIMHDLMDTENTLDHLNTVRELIDEAITQLRESAKVEAASRLNFETSLKVIEGLK